MKRREFIMLTALCAAQLALCGCVSQQSEELPELTIGYSEYRPYIYVDDNGQYAGTDAEIAIEACKRMGYKPVFREIVWERRDDYLANGEVDCLWSCFSMNDRENDYAWVGPYMNSREVVAVLRDSSIEKLADLAGKSVVVKATTKPESIFLERADKRIPKVKTVYSLTSAEEMAVALRNEYADAIAGHAGALRYSLDFAGVDYRILDEDLLQVKLGVAFAKDGDEVLRSKLSAALDAMLDDGTTGAIISRYGIDAQKALEGVRDEQQA